MWTEILKKGQKKRIIKKIKLEDIWILTTQSSGNEWYFCSDTQRWLFTRILHARWRDINIEMFPSLYILPGTEDLGVTEVRTLRVSVIMRYETNETWTRDGAEKLWLSTQFLLLIIRLESPLCLRARPTPSFASRLCPSVLCTIFSVLYCTVLYCTVLYCGPRSGLCLSLPGDNETHVSVWPGARLPVPARDPQDETLLALTRSLAVLAASMPHI